MEQQSVIQLRRAFHRIPETGFQERKTSALIQATLDQWGISYQSGLAGTGVLVTLGEGTPHIALRADIDGLPVQEQNAVEYASCHPGFMHACGHDCHIAVLLDVIRRTKKLYDTHVCQGRVSFLFQPSEECANAEGFSGGQLLSQLPQLKDVSHFYGAHIDSSMENGKIFLRDGALTAAIDRFEIEITGKAGHGAYPHQAVDPIWLASHAVNLINTLASRTVNTAYPAVISVCSFHGGTAWNVIPETVQLSGTIRTFFEPEREKLHRDLRACLETVRSFGGDYRLTIHRGYPSIVNSPEQCEFVRDAVRAVCGEEALRVTQLQMGGDDFACYAQNAPSCYFHAGAMLPGKPRRHHSGDFEIDEAVMETMSDIFTQIVKQTVIKTDK